MIRYEYRDLYLRFLFLADLSPTKDTTTHHSSHERGRSCFPAIGITNLQRVIGRAF